MSKDKLIVALDVPDLKKAEKLINKLSPVVSTFKVGNELFTAAGPQAVKLIHRKKRKVFLDLKFHDIPNTVAGAAQVATSLSVFMFNLHVSGGKNMMRETTARAEKAAKKYKTKMPLIIGVTVLTSLGEEDLKELGIKRFAKDQVLYLAKMAKECGLNGVVCSAQEAKRIKQLCGENFITVCPGIRPRTADAQDQKRITTPKEAIEQGADFIVVGRPITEAKDPLKAAQDILKEIS